MKNRRHACKNGDSVLFGKIKIPVKLEALHYYVRTPGAEYGKPPGEPHMSHRVNTEIYILLPDPERLALRIKSSHPVAVSEHRTFGFSRCPCSVLDMTEVLGNAVHRPHGSWCFRE